MKLVEAYSGTSICKNCLKILGSLFQEKERRWGDSDDKPGTYYCESCVKELIKDNPDASSLFYNNLVPEFQNYVKRGFKNN